MRVRVFACVSRRSFASCTRAAAAIVRASLAALCPSATALATHATVSPGRARGHRSPTRSSSYSEAWSAVSASSLMPRFRAW